MNLSAEPSPLVDILIDFSDLDASDSHTGVMALLDHGDLIHLGGRVSLFAPFLEIQDLASRAPARFRLERAGTGAQALIQAKRAAAKAGRALLVILGRTHVEPEAVLRLLSGFDVDPMIGCVEPRFCLTEANGLISLPPHADRGNLLPRAILADLPAFYLTCEHLAGCSLFHHNLIASIPDDTLGEAYDFKEALGRLQIEVRRRGFGTLILNRIVADVPVIGDAYPQYPAETADRLQQIYPEFADSRTRMANLPWRQAEAAKAATCLPKPSGELPGLILDCRGMPAYFNGTSECILGILDGLAALKTKWQFGILASPEAAAFHHLTNRYPTIAVHTSLPDRYAAVCIRLSQAWDIQTVYELHRMARYLAVHMLDTISWDILVPNHPATGPAWEFVAQYMDGLLYNSHYTKNRFQRRFVVADHVQQIVIHHSFHRDDHVFDAPAAKRDHILIFGNDYPHKAINETLSILTRAFPYQPIIAVGAKGKSQANLTILPSGEIATQEIERLYAGGRMLVYPSYYEGFGLPVVKGLNYGMDVVVRRSALAREIAANCRAPGRLLEFENNLDLVEIIGRALADGPSAPLPLGGGLDEGAEPLRWSGVAQRVIDLAQALLDQGETPTYLRREAALRLAKPEYQS
jgi:glycosyltransferase involved in cell wall biosynthesis